MRWALTYADGDVTGVASRGGQPSGEPVVAGRGTRRGSLEGDDHAVQSSRLLDRPRELIRQRGGAIFTVEAAVKLL